MRLKPSPPALMLSTVTALLALGLSAYHYGWQNPFAANAAANTAWETDTLEQSGVSLETITGQLQQPWSFAFLPNGMMLVSERGGTLQRLDPSSGALQNIAGVPEVYYRGQGGLLDVALHPAFPQQPWVYLSYSAPVERDKSATRLARARLEDNQLLDLEVLYTAQPPIDSRKHFGGRLLFDGDYLYLTSGERGEQDMAQQLDKDMGKVLRLTHDGRPAPGNPFSGQANARAGIYTLGHRNPQGLAKHPTTGDIWVTEHGPQGGDELNRLVPGANYGWPVITYGEQYGGGKIGEGSHKPGMEQPVYYYVPSIATGGLAFYHGGDYPGWEGNAFITALRGAHLNRLVLEEDGRVYEHRLLQSLNQRLRDVKLGPDGLLYVLSEQGSLFRLQPAGEHAAN